MSGCWDLSGDPQVLLWCNWLSTSWPGLCVHLCLLLHCCLHGLTEAWLVTGSIKLCLETKNLAPEDSLGLTDSQEVLNYVLLCYSVVYLPDPMIQAFVQVLDQSCYTEPANDYKSFAMTPRDLLRWALTHSWDVWCFYMCSTSYKYRAVTYLIYKNTITDFAYCPMVIWICYANGRNGKRISSGVVMPII